MTTPDTGRGATLRAVLNFLAAPSFLLILALTLHFTGVLTLEKATELIHGKKPEAVVVNPNGGAPKLDPPPPPGIGPAPGSPAPSVPPARPAPQPTTQAPPPNQPPVVTADSALAFGKGELSKVVELQVKDETPAGVKIEARSLDEGLVPAAGLRLEGAHLTVTPAPGKWGTATVRVTATDSQKLSGAADIRVTVPAPALALTKLPNLTVKRGDEVPAVTIGWVDESPVPGKVSVTARTRGPILPDAVAKVENKRLDLTPEKDKVGSSVVTVVVATDDGRRAEATFTLTVTPPPPLPVVAGGKARVRVNADATTLIYSNEAATDDLQGKPDGGLANMTLVTVNAVGARTCQITWAADGRTYTGWVSKDILVGEE